MPFHLSKLKIPYIAQLQSEIWNTELVFDSGGCYHIRARSGQGKSSLIHTLYGIQKNYEGKLFFKGKNAGVYTQDEWCDVRARQLSIVFQDLRLFEDMTALQNLLVKNELTAFTSADTVLLWADRLGIAHALQRKIHTLSYGERQRVAIIRALLQPFECLLLDEPFSHLDQENIRVASELIFEEVSKKKATLIVCDLESDTHFPYHVTLNL
ncbi:MAG: ATP-binding cassette domain-containing protein [Chitinophagaceae bacterium]|nr:ATP-binding cassette domain-containing protein [Chitinophagaceae bacterium]